MISNENNDQFNGHKNCNGLEMMLLFDEEKTFNMNKSK